MFDARLILFWGTDTNSQVDVLSPDPEQADTNPLDCVSTLTQRSRTNKHTAMFIVGNG